MERIITMENIRKFAYVSDAVCQKPIRGIVVFFFGLGGDDMYDEEAADGIMFGREGILYVVPYNNPWAWMNRQAVAYTDEILDVLFEAYNLPADTPVVAMGGSMGGHGALIYTKYSKRTPVLCDVNCPVCDMVYHFTERKDLPRTIYSSLFNEEGTLEDALKRVSPYHLAEELPKVKYMIFHCDEDGAVNLEKHSGRFVERMREVGHDISLDIVHGRGHCDLSSEMWEKYEQACITAVNEYHASKA